MHDNVNEGPIESKVSDDRGRMPVDLTVEGVGQVKELFKRQAQGDVE